MTRTTYQSNFQRAGTLHKRGKGGSLFKSRGWKKRWFVLKEGKLSYFEYKRTKAYYFKPIGVVRLTRHDFVVTYEEDEKSPFTFTFKLVTPARTFYLCASSEDERNMWIDCITAAINADSKRHNRIKKYAGTL